MGVALAGCIQPVEPTALPSPTLQQVQPVNPPPAATSTLDPGAAGAAPVVPTPVVQFLQGRGEVPGDLRVWYDQPQGIDHLYGFSYSNANGLACAGFLLTAVDPGVAPNGAIHCAEGVGIPAMASVSLFATTDGQPYTVVFGRVEDPTITVLSIIFSDGSSQPVIPIDGGFLTTVPGVLGANMITAINAQGNTVIDNIPQSPAS